MKKGNVNNFIKALKTALMLLGGAFLLASSIHIFTIPAQFAPGGVSGLSSIIQITSGFPAAYSMIILNFPIVLTAFFTLSKKFTLLSVIGILLSAGFLQLFDYVNFYEFVRPNEAIVSAMAGGIMSGTAIGIMIKAGASSGGTEIIGMLIQKKCTSLSISWIIFSMNFCIICLGGLLYTFVKNMEISRVLSIVFFSLLQVFLASKSMEVVLNGLTSAIKFEVVTSKGQELSEAIFAHINRGVTIINSHGGFTKEENSVVICVVTKMQISQFKKILKEVDPCAFAFAMNTREVLGNGFQSKK